MKFEEALKEYLEYAKNRHKKQGFVTLASNFNSRILPYFSNFMIEDVKPKDVVNWQNKIYELNFKYSYTSKLYINFCSFFDYCCNFYDISFNPVKKVGNFRKDYLEKKIDFYTINEFKRFINGVDDIIYRRFFEIMFYCGTRPGEALALKFSDLGYHTLHISKTLTSKGGITLDTPKNKSSIRTIPIDNILYKDLLSLKSYYSKLFGAYSDDYFICGGINHLSPTTVNRRKKEACIKADIRPITLHQFRHSHASLLCSSGVPVNLVSKRLGHSRLSTTTDIYIHCNLDQEKRVTNTLNFIRNNFFITLASNFNKLFYILKHK